MNDLDLREKVAVVTGATGNLGRTLCRTLLDRGAKVALIGRNSATLESLQAELGARDRTAGFEIDLREANAVQSGVDRIVEQFGGIHILVNAAGGFRMGPPLHETADEDWEAMMDINARSVFTSCKAVIPHMLAAGGGQIVNVSARAAKQGKGRMGPYCASKAAVVALTESLAEEHRDTGIRVNCILPGTIDTPQNRAAMPDADYRCWVSPEALSDVVLFLLSDASRAIQGASIPVYGRS